MLSYHNDAAIKNKYLKRVIAHRKADTLIQGSGWDGVKGCAVGCTLEAYDHARYPIELGLPEWLARLEDRLFERLNIKEALKWPEAFLKAIPIGIKEAKFETLRHKLAVLQQTRNLKCQQKLLKKQTERHTITIIKTVIKAVELVIAYHKKPNENARLAVRLVAQSARSRAESVPQLADSAAALLSARLVAYSAEQSAWSALQSLSQAANSAADSAAWSIEPTTYKPEAMDLLKLLKGLK